MRELFYADDKIPIVIRVYETLRIIGLDFVVQSVVLGTTTEKD